MEFNNLLKLMIGLAFECLTNFIFQNKTLRDLRELRGEKKFNREEREEHEGKN